MVYWIVLVTLNSWKPAKEGKQAETPLIEVEQLETDEGGHTLTSLTEGN